VRAFSFFAKFFSPNFSPNFFRGFHDPSGEDLVEEDPDVGVGHVAKEGDVEEGEGKRS
jgi:hypothetical protein